MAQPKFVTKPGKYGTLYRYVVEYTDAGDTGFGRMTWSTWAYSLEHVEDKFHDLDEGFKILSIHRQHEGLSQHRAVRHEPRSSARRSTSRKGKRKTGAKRQSRRR
jgi:hypothetical protein